MGRAAAAATGLQVCSVRSVAPADQVAFKCAFTTTFDDKTTQPTAYDEEPALDGSGHLTAFG
jgi:hypothetical protein